MFEEDVEKPKVPKNIIQSQNMSDNRNSFRSKSNSQAYREGRSSVSNNEDLKIIARHNTNIKDNLSKSTSPNKPIQKRRGRSIYSRASQEMKDDESNARDTNLLEGQLIDIHTGNFPNSIINIGKSENVEAEQEQLKNRVSKRKHKKRNKVSSKGNRKAKKELNPILSQHCRVRSVIQPKIDRKEIKPNFSQSRPDYQNKDSIRIPSMSWYIKNCILPKKGKEIQETIEKYISKGGSLNNKSLPKRLIEKRKSVKVEVNSPSFVENSPNNDYATGYQRYANESKRTNEIMLHMHNAFSQNPELKNLNFKAAEQIVRQKLEDKRVNRFSQQFMGRRKAKHRSRVNTAEQSNNISQNGLADTSKPMSAQVSVRGMSQLNVSSNQELRYAQNMASQLQAHNEVRYQKMLKELEEEMKKIGDDNESEKEIKPKILEDLKPIGFNKHKIQVTKQVVPQGVKRPKIGANLRIEKPKFKMTKLRNDNSSTLKNISPGVVKNQKNDAATSTHQDMNYNTEMLSFQVVNNSPTFEGDNKELYIGQSSPGSRSPIENSKDESDIVKSKKGARLEDDPYKSPGLNTERHVGGGFKYSNLSNSTQFKFKPIA